MRLARRIIRDDFSVVVMRMPATEQDHECLPQLTPAYVEAAKAEARSEVACAVSQLDLFVRARTSFALIGFDCSDDELSSLEQECAQICESRFTNARTHIRFATSGLFDAYADAYWKLISPSAIRFTSILRLLGDHVQKD